MSVRLYLQTKLDLGDIGLQSASVVGTVRERGLFGPGWGYLEVKIEEVAVHIDGCPLPVKVISILSKAALVSIEEELERFYESEKVHGEGA